MWMSFKTGDQYLQTRKFCLKCSKINTNQNGSFNKHIYNTCNVIDAAENLNYHSNYLSN